MGLELEYHSVSWLAGCREHQIPQEEGMMSDKNTMPHCGARSPLELERKLEDSGSYGVWLVGWWNTRLNTPAVCGG